eukprot:1593137-Rhodomonas_salina.1
MHVCVESSCRLRSVLFVTRLVACPQIKAEEIAEPVLLPDIGVWHPLAPRVFEDSTEVAPTFFLLTCPALAALPNGPRDVENSMCERRVLFERRRRFRGLASVGAREGTQCKIGGEDRSEEAGRGSSRLGDVGQQRAGLDGRQAS